MRFSGGINGTTEDPARPSTHSRFSELLDRMSLGWQAPEFHQWDKVCKVARRASVCFWVPLSEAGRCVPSTAVLGTQKREELNPQHSLQLPRSVGSPPSPQHLWR